MAVDPASPEPREADDAVARRVALALVRFFEAGDQAAGHDLLAGLSPDELREVLSAQTRNVSLVFAAVFGERLNESRLPGIAHDHGRTRAAVIDDYLERLIVRFALAEAEQK